MRKKSPRKKAVERLDKVFSLYIRQRDRACFTCGTRENLQCGHLITRSKYSVRWDEGNAFAQCRSCNMENEWNPDKMRAEYIKRFGAKKYIDLVERSNHIRKFSTQELIAMADDYENKTKGKI